MKKAKTKIVLGDLDSAIVFTDAGEIEAYLPEQPEDEAACSSAILAGLCMALFADQHDDLAQELYGRVEAQIIKMRVESKPC